MFVIAKVRLTGSPKLKEVLFKVRVSSRLPFSPDTTGGEGGVEGVGEEMGFGEELKVGEGVRAGVVLEGGVAVEEPLFFDVAFWAT